MVFRDVREAEVGKWFLGSFLGLRKSTQEPGWTRYPSIHEVFGV